MYNVFSRWQKNQAFNNFFYPVFLVALLFFIVSCNGEKKNNAHKNVSNSSIKKGKELAAVYCRTCHLLPDPSQLDAKNWEQGVLPAMGPHFGIFSYGFQMYPSNKNDQNLPINYYPSKPVLNNIEWQNIIDYYTALSPEVLPAQGRTAKIDLDLSTFKVEFPPFNYPSPAVSLSKIDTGSSPRHLYFSDIVSKKILQFNGQLMLTDTINTNASITDIDFSEGTMLACNINIINPNNGKFGNAQLINKGIDGRLNFNANAFFDSLQRPVQITSCDLNNDKKTDYLVCEFGHLSGSLSWMENKGNGKYQHHIIKAAPGAIKAYVEDVNHDGLQDVWALFSQGDEGISLFTNKGNGQFEEKRVLRFPAIYGSTYFELVDFNKDGLKDIIYTCGDNADYSMVLKPYHGVYIFLNEGDNNFKQKYFFPINGCYKAMAKDYDNDGDIDIATIAFFSDYATQPYEGFVYLKNEGNFNFKPYSIAGTEKGRWLTMDSGDIDGDGKIDIVLGNFSIRPSKIKPTVNWQKGPPFIVLKNITK